MCRRARSHSRTFLSAMNDGGWPLRRAREREHREVYTKTEKSKETRYKILLENQNFLLNSVSENKRLLFEILGEVSLLLP